MEAAARGKYNPAHGLCDPGDSVFNSAAVWKWAKHPVSACRAASPFDRCF